MSYLKDWDIIRVVFSLIASQTASSSFKNNFSFLFYLSYVDTFLCFSFVIKKDKKNYIYTSVYLLEISNKKLWKFIFNYSEEKIQNFKDIEGNLFPHDASLMTF